MLLIPSLYEDALYAENYRGGRGNTLRVRVAFRSRSVSDRRRKAFGNMNCPYMDIMQLHIELVLVKFTKITTGIFK